MDSSVSLLCWYAILQRNWKSINPKMILHTMKLSINKIKFIFLFCYNTVLGNKSFLIFIVSFFLQMRVLKLAQSWTTMKVLLSIIISTLGALGNLTFLLIIVIYIFAVLGMQLFAKTYTEENFAPDRVPR